MAIPAFEGSGLLPPYVGNPTQSVNHSPFRATMVEVAQRFCQTQPRRDLFARFLSFRSQLHSIGIVAGFQWLNGSFSEDIEAIEARSPKDIDVVTFFHRPVSCASQADWNLLVHQYGHLFDNGFVKNTYRCDAYFLDLDLPNMPYAVDLTRFFNSLFSHKRVTRAWKGMLRVELDPAADAAAAALIGLGP